MTTDEVRKRYLRVRTVQDTILCRVELGVVIGTSVGLGIHTDYQNALDEVNDIADVLTEIIEDAAGAVE